MGTPVDEGLVTDIRMQPCRKDAKSGTPKTNTNINGKTTPKNSNVDKKTKQGPTNYRNYTGEVGTEEWEEKLRALMTHMMSIFHVWYRRT